MENPYEPTNVNQSRTTLVEKIVLVGIVQLVSALVVVNYATANSLSISLYNSFPHVLFAAAPVSIAAHINQLLKGPGNHSQRSKLMVLTPALVILIAFCVSWLGYFSSNPYEQFALVNRYSGSQGGILWMWLVTLGVLPLANALATVQRKRWLEVCISCVALMAHSHNATSVWFACHIQS